MLKLLDCKWTKLSSGFIQTRGGRNQPPDLEHDDRSCLKRTSRPFACLSNFETNVQDAQSGRHEEP
jgi:hypothetical protein